MRSLSLKLMAAFLVVSLIGVALASLLARWITVQEFNRLVFEQAEASFLAEVTSYYRAHGSWVGVTEYFRQKAQAPEAPPRPANPGNPPPSREAAPQQPRVVPIILIDSNGNVLHPVPPYRAGDYLAPLQYAQGIPVMVNGQSVGTILAIGSAPPLSEQEQQYLDRTNQALVVSALGAVVIALGLGLVLARTLTRPLRELTAAIRAMARGQLGIAVPVRSHDEIGELTASFNQMSADLGRSNQLRRQMTADIAHDLRTPLTVIGGYVESLGDGVLEPTPERFDILKDQVQYLLRLVEDLRTLSIADAGELKLDLNRVSPEALLSQAAAAFQRLAEQKQITLRLACEPGLTDIDVDEIRIAQVLGNLLSNALRYTPEGGSIVLSACHEASRVVLSVQDNGAGMTSEVLPHVFERFYRADPARHGESESGLGLAIAKALVEAHHGTVTAASEGIGRGSVFSVYLPE